MILDGETKSEVWNIGYRHSYSFVGIMGQKDGEEHRGATKKDHCSTTQVFQFNSEIEPQEFHKGEVLNFYMDGITGAIKDLDGKTAGHHYKNEEKDEL